MSQEIDETLLKGIIRDVLNEVQGAEKPISFGGGSTATKAHQHNKQTKYIQLTGSSMLGSQSQALQKMKL